MYKDFYRGIITIVYPDRINPNNKLLCKCYPHESGGLKCNNFITNEHYGVVSLDHIELIDKIKD